MTENITFLLNMYASGNNSGPSKKKFSGISLSEWKHESMNESMSVNWSSFFETPEVGIVGIFE